MDAKTILAVTDPAAVFGTSESEITQTWRVLAKTWHPDANRTPIAGAVFAHLTELRAAALKRAQGCPGAGPAVFTFATAEGRTWQFSYRRRRPIDLGEVMVGPTTLLFRVAPENADLADSAVQRLRTLRFADESMRAAMRRHLPVIALSETAEDGARVLVVPKRADHVLLADLIEHLGGRIDPRHVGWIVNGLLNIACWLSWAGLVHGGIAADAHLVSPEHHDGLLAGGWFYTVAGGMPLAALPPAVADGAPSDVLRDGRADPRLDLEAIRSLGRTLLGDPGGTRLRRDPAVPGPLAEWLVAPTAGDALDDYRTWRTALDAAFGKRRFVALPVRAADLYA